MLAPAVLALIAITLASCSTGSRTHTKAWQQGYQAGREAIAHHTFQAGATSYDKAAFCAVTAYNEIQGMKHDLVQWTEGFDKGCGHV